MNEPSEKIGKRISDIRILKSKVVIYFADDNKLEISKDCYTEFKFYINKVISDEEYQKIINFNNSHKNLEYALKLISKGSYSKKEVIDKLKKKSISDEEINYVINYLNNNKLINDKEYANNYVEQAVLNHKGPVRIKHELKNRGIDDLYIEKALSDVDINVQINNIKEIINKLNKQYRDPYRKKKEKITASLIRKGYSYEAINRCLYLVNDDKSIEQYKILKKKISNLLDRYGSDPAAIKKYIITKLEKEGYSYSKIKEALGEITNDIY